MAHQLSKVVANRQKATDIAIGAAKTYGPVVAPKVDALFFKRSTPTFRSIDVFDACADILDFSIKDYVNSDRDVALERWDDKYAGQDHDDGIAKCREAIIGLKNSLNAVFYDGKADEYGLRGETSHDPKLLASTVKNVINLLKEKPDMGKPRSGFAAPDIQEIIRGLEENVKALETSSKSSVKERGEYKLAIRNRDLKGEDWERIYGNVAGILSHLFSIGKRDDLADLVKPTSRKKSGKEEPGEEIPQEQPPAPNTTIGSSNATTPSES